MGSTPQCPLRGRGRGHRGEERRRKEGEIRDKGLDRRTERTGEVWGEREGEGRWGRGERRRRDWLEGAGVRGLENSGEVEGEERRGKKTVRR